MTARVYWQNKNTLDPMQHFKLGWEQKLCPIFSKCNKITLSLETKMTLNARVTESKKQRESSTSTNYKNLRRSANCDFASQDIFFLQQIPFPWKDLSLHTALPFSLITLYTLYKLHILAHNPPSMREVLLKNTITKPLVFCRGRVHT